jgi:hypothetical protein
MAKLDLGIIQDAVLFPFRHPFAVLRLGLVPILIFLTATQVLISHLILFASEMTSSSWIAAGLSTVLLLLVYPVLTAAFAVGICRLILKGETPRWTVLGLGRNERAHAGVVLLLLLLTVALQTVFAGVGWIAAIVHDAGFGFRALIGLGFAVVSAALFALAFWVYMRLALTLPHAAMSGERSLRTSWNAMDGHFWRFAAALLIVSGLGAMLSLLLMAPIMIAGALATEVLAPDYGPWFLTVRMIMLMPVTLLILSMLIALIAYAYRDLVARDSEPHRGEGIKAVDEWRGAAISHG